MKIKNTVIVLFVFISMCMNAQTFFKPGYVIKSVGDTLFGEVDYRGDNRMTKVCTYRHNSKDIVRHFSPDEILGYRFPDSKYYISKEVDGKKVFLEFLINGRVNVYYSKDNGGEDHYYIEKDSLGFAEIPYKEEYKVKDQQEYLSKSTRHIGLLNYYMQDANGLQQEILNLKKPGHHNLITLATDYHNAVCNGDKCIIYEKRLPPFKVGLEFTGGMLFIKDPILGNYKFSQAGIIAHIWMPMISENLFLKTGVLLETGVLLKPAEYPDQVLSGTQIPIQVEYVYPHGIIRPKFAVGTNLPFMSLDMTPGVNIKLTKWLSLSANFNMGFIPGYKYGDNDTAYAKVLIFSRTFSTGLYMKL